ncbi:MULTISPECIES: hypothetical protein [Vibrio]|uniref:hypothetical protein n=1 Tax=Vibrio TaxID=662 RepID=UPI001E42DFDF|nr:MULTISPECIES: hypothetical protein [Vibrio]MCC2524969.1 hypothetical protein [Vibrio coralliilyticus]USD35514.1 hypothetical protein J8Z27_23120 [Vibrio sp. SCSIO 43186]USD72638.1 hypothetical protein J4N41_23125 [Vibrio sp. SCSIO 43139]USD98851.1 hypothetical protein CTT30_22470 [Vibrio coralliilyticus]
MDSKTGVVPKVQLALVLCFAIATLITALVSQQIGIMLALFLAFIARRIRNGWQQSRGQMFLPEYLGALAGAAGRFYAIIIAVVLVYFSQHDFTSFIDTHATMDPETGIDLQSNSMIWNQIIMLSTFIVFTLTLIRIVVDLSKGSIKTDGSFITTLLWLAVSLYNVVKHCFTKKPAQES